MEGFDVPHGDLDWARYDVYYFVFVCLVTTTLVDHR